MDPATRRQLEAERLARVAARQAQAHALTHGAQPQTLAAAAAAAAATSFSHSSTTAASTPDAPLKTEDEPLPATMAPAYTDTGRKRQRSTSSPDDDDDDLPSRALPPTKVARRAGDQGARDRREPSSSSSTRSRGNDNVVVLLSSSSDDDDDDDVRIVERKPSSSAAAASSRSAATAVSGSARQYSVPPTVLRQAGPVAAPTASSSHRVTPKYLDGRFCMTAIGASSSSSSSSQPATIRFSDLVDKNHITAAVLSSYVWEEAWLLPHFPADTRFCFINNAKSPIQLPPTLAATSRIVTPPLHTGGNFGCMHTKLCLLVYPGFIRFVLGSANLIAYDWTGMANVVYVHDFPRRTPQSPANATEFYDAQLAPLMRDLGVPEGIHKIVGQCDSSEFVRRGRRLVRSRPGSYLPGDGYGLAGMVDAARACGLAAAPAGGLVLTCATSSVGSLDEEYLRLWGDGIVRGQFAPVATATSTEVRIVYPTCDEVVRGVYGVEGGGSVWLRREVWEKAGFPRDRFWTLDARFKGYLSHAKTIVVLPNDLASVPADGQTPIGLYYAGSHNFTRAAWGSLTKREAKCRMSNYETGIVCPITSADQVGSELPVAYGSGSRKYDLSKAPERDGDVPWMQELFQDK